MLMDASCRCGPSSVLSYTGWRHKATLRFAEEIVKERWVNETALNEERRPYLRHCPIRLPLSAAEGL